MTALFLSKKGQVLLHEIFDPRLMGMDDIESMKSVANLAESCLNVDVQLSIMQSVVTYIGAIFPRLFSSIILIIQQPNILTEEFN